MSHIKLFAVILIIGLSGCATTYKGLNSQIEGLQNQIDSLQGQNKEKELQIKSLQESLNKEKSQIQNNKKLESRLKQKDKTIESLQNALDKESKGRAVLSERINALTGQSKGKTSKNYIKRIQTALKKAGYDPGVIDGVLGSKTRKAIRYFQKANGLEITGNINKSTWMKLKKFSQVK